MLVLGGISETGRYYVAYVYAVEIFPSKAQSVAGIVVFLVFALGKMFVCLQFMYIESRQWLNLAHLSIVFAAFSLASSAYWMPESPRYLHSRKRFTEAADILKRMQKFNKMNESYKFQFIELEEENSAL